MKIRFATDTLRRLGEELNPSVDKGILELAKNAYDADAVNCTIELIDTQEPNGTIVITDDGDGMTADEVENGWLVLGRSGKDQRKRTGRGRVPAGCKGLGRLAALRMGSRTWLTTRPKAMPGTEYSLLIDWDAYTAVDMVDDVALELQKSNCDPTAKPGTKIRVEKVRSKIGRQEAKRLARELILLADPFGDDLAGFRPVLKAPEFSDLEALVRERYFEEADYHLVAHVRDDGTAAAQVLDWRGKPVHSGEHADIAPHPQRLAYVCPPLRFELWSFLLGKGRFGAKTVPVGDVRGWLQEFGGVHIYQNGLRVTPYGDPETDWLDMNLSRVRSPEERPSTNNSIGRVVFDDTGTLLVQKTDRSGFIESDAFQQIRQFARDALEWMARRRMEDAQKRREQDKAAVRKTTTATRSDLDAAVEKLPKTAREPLRKAVEYAWRAVDKEIQQYQQEIQLYRTLSTAGITTATFAHESAGNPLKVIRASIAAVARRARKCLTQETYEAELRAPVDSVARAAESLAVLGDATLKLLDHEKRRSASVDIHQVVLNVLETFRPFLDARDVQVETDLCEGAPYLLGSEAAVESIVTNLLNNSVAAFERSPRRVRRIVIRTHTTNGHLSLRLADTGPGIEEIRTSEIWLPGRTTRKNGTGLGLTIVRDTASDLGGEVEAVAHGELGGAEITIRMPILGV
jgi:signal transduction histidine kinase